MRLNLALRAAPRESSYLHTPLMAFMAVLRTANLELYKDFLAGGADAADVMHALRDRSRGAVFANTKPGMIVEAYLIYTTADKQKKDDLIREVQARAKREAANDDTAVRDLELYTYLQNLSLWQGDHARQALLHRLELVSRRISS